MKKNLIFKLVIALLSIAIGIGCYFNYKSEANCVGIAGISFVTSVFFQGFVEAARMLIAEEKFNWRYPASGILIAVLCSLICVIL